MLPQVSPPSTQVLIPLHSQFHMHIYFFCKRKSYNEVYSILKFTCFVLSNIYIKMIVDPHWNRTIPGVKLHCVELIAGQLLTLNIPTVQGLKN